MSIADRRVVIFSDAWGRDNINIIDLKTGDLLDSFGAVNARMSPNRRWIAYEEFYPEHTDEPVSNRYRLYDPGVVAALA